MANKTLGWLLRAKWRSSAIKDNIEHTQKLLDILQKEALTEQDLAEFKSLLEIQKVNPNTQYGPSNKSPIILATEKRHIECLKLLIANKADINFKDKDGCTALMTAVKQDDEELLNLLIANGADVNKVDRYGNNALIYSVGAGDLKTLKILLAKKAKVNSKNKYGQTALMRAATLGIVAAIDILAQHKALINLKSADHMTALMIAAQKGQNACLKRIIYHGGKINLKDASGYTALMLAAINGQDDCVKTLIEHKANINSQNNSHATAFVLAAGSNHISCLQSLKATGQITPTQLGRALQRAAISGHCESIHQLLQMGADKNYTDRANPETAAQLAGRFRYDACVALLNGGPYINPREAAVVNRITTIDDYIAKNINNSETIIKCLQIWKNKLNAVDSNYSCEDPFTFDTLSNTDNVELHLGKTIEGGYTFAAYQDGTFANLIKTYLQSKINLGPDGAELVAVTKGVLKDLITHVEQLIAKYSVDKPNDSPVTAPRNAI